MTGRGRRDNGLDAALWSPLRDVDPRVGEHLLDVLYDAGIAAYLEPAADVAPYTRTVYLPSPPSDRLFVDRGRRAEARLLVDAHADEHARGQVHERARLRSDLDEEAEWQRIVAAFEAEHGHTSVEDAAPVNNPPMDTAPTDTAPMGTAPTDTAADAPLPPPPPPAEPDVLDRPEEHFEPPPPPPVPVPKPSTLYSFLLVAAGIILVWAPSVIGLSSDAGLVLGVAAVAAGVGTAVMRMRERSTDDGDDGAVV